MDIPSLNVTVLVISVIFLGYAAYSDLRTREISNRVWAIYLPISCVILVFRLLLNPQLIVISVISFLIISCLSLATFYLGLFGGADLKAFICLGIALPFHPLSQRTVLISVNPIFPLTIFYNTYLFSLSVTAYCLAKNFYWRYFQHRELFRDLRGASFLKKVMALVTGYKTNFETLRKKMYLYPMEESSKENNGSHRKLKFFTDAEADRDELVQGIGESLSDSEKGSMWVTPGLPLLLFACLALISSTFIGDVLFWVVQRMMSLFIIH